MQTQRAAEAEARNQAREGRFPGRLVTWLAEQKLVGGCSKERTHHAGLTSDSPATATLTHTNALSPICTIAIAYSHIHTNELTHAGLSHVHTFTNAHLHIHILANAHSHIHTNAHTQT